MALLVEPTKQWYIVINSTTEAVIDNLPVPLAQKVPIQFIPLSRVVHQPIKDWGFYRNESQRQRSKGFISQI